MVLRRVSTHAPRPFCERERERERAVLFRAGAARAALTRAGGRSGAQRERLRPPRDPFLKSSQIFFNQSSQIKFSFRSGSSFAAGCPFAAEPMGMGPTRTVTDCGLGPAAFAFFYAYYLGSVFLFLPLFIATLIDYFTNPNVQVPPRPPLLPPRNGASRRPRWVNTGRGEGPGDGPDSPAGVLRPQRRAGGYMDAPAPPAVRHPPALRADGLKPRGTTLRTGGMAAANLRAGRGRQVESLSLFNGNDCQLFAEVLPPPPPPPTLTHTPRPPRPRRPPLPPQPPTFLSCRPLLPSGPGAHSVPIPVDLLPVPVPRGLQSLHPSVCRSLQLSRADSWAAAAAAAAACVAGAGLEGLR
jgi:hypothetical protein